MRFARPRKMAAYQQWVEQMEEGSSLAAGAALCCLKLLLPGRIVLCWEQTAASQADASAAVASALRMAVWPCFLPPACQ